MGRTDWDYIAIPREMGNMIDSIIKINVFNLGIRCIDIIMNIAIQNKLIHERSKEIMSRASILSRLDTWLSIKL